VLLGQTWARWAGVVLAVISGLAGFLFLPFYPFWPILVIAVDVFIIWALVTPGGGRTSDSPPAHDAVMNPPICRRRPRARSKGAWLAAIRSRYGCPRRAPRSRGASWTRTPDLAVRQRPGPVLGGEMTGNTDRGGGQIVVGVDGTAAAAAAVRWAILEARLRQASVHLVFARDHDRHSRAPYAGRPGAQRPE